MSRIGNKPVQIPAGVEVAVNGNNVVVKGPKGQLELDVFEKLAINVEDNVLTVSRPDDERETRARHGLTRALIHIMSIEASVEELYGDSRDEEWKAEEVARLKAEQGITEISEPEVSTEGVQIKDDEGQSDEPPVQDEQEGIPGTSQSSV